MRDFIIHLFFIFIQIHKFQCAVNPFNSTDSTAANPNIKLETIGVV